MGAIAAQFVKFDAVPTRKVARITLEVAIEKANDVLKDLGGYPDAANAKWCGIALLKGEPTENTLKGGKLAQRAGILCSEGAFKAFCVEELCHSDPVQAIYERCGVTSRAHLDHDEDAGRKFHDLDTEYKVWRGVA